MYNKQLQKPIFTGMLVAIGIVLSEFLAISLPPTAHPVIRFSIGYLPIILAGVFYGPVYGGVAGIVQDLVGFFLFGLAKGYVFHPGYTLNAALYGIIPALLIRSVFKREKSLFYALNYVAAGVLLGLSTWFFFDIERVYSSTLDASAKLLLSGVRAVRGARPRGDQLPPPQGIGNAVQAAEGALRGDRDVRSDLARSSRRSGSGPRFRDTRSGSRCRSGS
ncbi:MAG: folate family ECF transporter S component [Bacillus subtilis]|nr:folate family ECF transporter S component [Bacillus subtilis]